MYKYEKEKVVIKSQMSKKSYIMTLLVTYAACIVIAIFGGLLVYGLEGLFMYILSILPISILYI